MQRHQLSGTARLRWSPGVAADAESEVERKNLGAAATRLIALALLDEHHVTRERRRRRVGRAVLAGESDLGRPVLDWFAAPVPAHVAVARPVGPRAEASAQREPDSLSSSRIFPTFPFPRLQNDRAKCVSHVTLADARRNTNRVLCKFAR